MGLRFVTITANVSGNNVLVAGVAGKRIKVWGMNVVADGGVGFYLRSSTTGTFHVGDDTDIVELATSVEWALPIGDKPWFQCDVGLSLDLFSDDLPNISGCLVYSIDEVDWTAL